LYRDWISRSAIPAQRTEWRHLRCRESRNQIKVLRDTNGDGKCPTVAEIFAQKALNKPFGIAFCPPAGDDPAGFCSVAILMA